MTPPTSITIDDARRVVVEAVLDIAPDLEGTEIPAEADLREDLDLDSMDLVNLTAALSERLGADIPERDYSLLETVDACAAYLRDGRPAMSDMTFPERHAHLRDLTAELGARGPRPDVRVRAPARQQRHRRRAASRRSRS